MIKDPYVEMGKVVPGSGPKFFLNRIGTKMFFLDRDRDQNIFDWDRHQNLFLKGPGPRPKTFSRRDRDRGQNFFLAGTGTKNDWSRSSLSLWQYRIFLILWNGLVILIMKKNIRSLMIDQIAIIYTWLKSNEIFR